MNLKKVKYDPDETLVAREDKVVVFSIPEQLERKQVRISNAILQQIGNFIIDGLTEPEACLMANFDYETFSSMKDKDPKLSEFIRKQFVKLKHKHLQIIQKNPTDKNSQWVLEKVFPDEFGTRKKGDDTNPLNALAAIIKSIQHDPTTHIIREARGTDVTAGAELARILDVAESLG